MLAYDWRLALVAFAVAMPLAFVLRAVQSRLVRGLRRGPPQQRRHVGHDRRGRVGHADDPRLRRRRSARTPGPGRGRGEDHGRRSGPSLLGAFLFPSGEIFSAFTIAAVVGLGVWMGPSDSLTAGALVGFIFLTYRFLEPIAEFTEVLDQTQNAVAGLRRVLSVLDLPIGPPPPDDPIPLPDGHPADRHPRCDVRLPESRSRRRSRDRDDSAVLKHIDVTIPAGQQVAMVGSTGSGKTTLGRSHRPLRRSDDRRDRTRWRAAAARRPRRAAPGD